MNTEYEIWNLMYLGFISNAMFMVAMVLLTWLDSGSLQESMMILMQM